MRFDLSLPLLTKELAEQSARPRTYIIRGTYAALLYGVVLTGFHQQMGGHWGAGSFDLLGSGRILFQQVLWSQLGAVYLVLPALMAGVITNEKERDTLGLLLITKLRPWTIVLEKFLSRVIPMLLYLSLSLPLLGVAYSLGGVNSGQVYLAGLILCMAVLHIGAAGVLCSVWFRTTAQSLVATYLLTIPIAAVSSAAARSLAAENSFSASAAQYLAELIFSSMTIVIGSLVPAGLGLVLASSLLWHRAFLTSHNYLLKILQAVDRFFHEINQNSVTQGIVLIRDQIALPEYAPIAWKETQKRSMGTLRYLIRLLLLIEVPLLFLILVPLNENIAWDRGNKWLDFGSLLVWWIAIFAILASSTSLISGERARQTLDVLLSTPMTAQRIIHEKFAGVRRLIFVLWIPLGTMLGFRVWWLAQVSRPSDNFHGGLQILQTTGAALVYLPLLGWIGLHASLRFRSQIAAMTACLVLVVVVLGLPRAWEMVAAGGPPPSAILTVLLVTLPATASAPPGHFFPLAYGLVGLHFLIYTVLWRCLRGLAAPALVRLTGRCETGTRYRYAEAEMESARQLQESPG